MEDLSGVVFVLLFIALSVLEGVGRKRKAKRKGGPVTGPAPRPREAPSRSPDVRADAARRKGSPGEEKGSEGLIPKDVWEEILGLARGAPTRTGKEEPVPAGPPSTQEGQTLEEIPPFEARSLEHLHPREDDGAPGRDQAPTLAEGPSSRSAPTGRPGAPTGTKGRKATTSGTVPAPLQAPVRALPPRRVEPTRKILTGASPEELRKAIVVKEVLDLPISLRE